MSQFAPLKNHPAPTNADRSNAGQGTSSYARVIETRHRGINYPRNVKIVPDLHGNSSDGGSVVQAVFRKLKPRERELFARVIIAA